MTIDYSKREVAIKGTVIPLTRREFDIVELLSILIENIARIETYTGRIERYVEAMSSAGRLEQIQLEKTFTDPQILARELENAIRLVVADDDKQLSFTSTVNAGKILLDKNVLFQITENIVSNAIRFAK